MGPTETLRTIDEYWAGYFGCRPEDLSRPGVLAVPHAALSGHLGVLVFRHGPTCVLSVPDLLLPRVRAAVRGRAPDEVFRADFLKALFDNEIDQISGPAWVGFADRDSFRSARLPGTRLLHPEDEAALRRLAEGCGEMAWKQSKVVFNRVPLYGHVEGEEIVAASGYQVLGGVIAYIGVVTHPAHRGKGYGKTVASASTEHALGKGLLAQWRTLRANAPAVAMAERMGFREYAATLDVHLDPGF